MKQNYNNYSEDDHQVWELLFKRQVENLGDKACTPYLTCLSTMHTTLHSQSIPKFEELSKTLYQNTGWSIEVVPGHIPVPDFFRLLAKKRFPSSTWLRSLDQIDYLEEPDMFHDIFGHVPLLMDKNYAHFMHVIGQLGVKWSRNIHAVSALRSLYWFTIEFGLVSEGLDRRIYGAGILSSFGESKQVMDAQTACIPFDISRIMHTDFRTDTMQNTYFTAHSFDEFLNCLEDVEKFLKTRSIIKAADR